jgi:hypothetical protein
MPDFYWKRALPSTSSVILTFDRHGELDDFFT